MLHLIAHVAPLSALADSFTQRLWLVTFPWWEFILRAVIIYGFVLLLLRITGKRQVGQLAPFDLVLLLILSNAVQNSMNGGDNSVTGGIISAVTLVGLNYFVGYLTFRFKWLEAVIEGRPVMLVHDGQVIHKAMNSVRMTIHELNASLRAAGCCGPHEVQTAVLENSGSITVIPKHLHADTPHPQAPTHPPFPTAAP